MKSRLLSLLLTCACAGLARADFNPVQLTPGSYTYDIVVESNAPQALPYCINATSGSGTSEGDNTYYEQGLHGRPGQAGYNSGIPIHNTVFTNINNPRVTFLMPPDYTTNNDLQLDSGLTTGAFTFNTPTTATNLAILSGGAGSGVVNYTVNHSDGSSDAGSINLSDWFTPNAAQIAWGANGRITSGGTFNNYNSSSVNNNNPYLYSYYITVAGGSPITNISLTFSSGNEQNFYAVSGNGGGTNWTPIPVSGFTRMTIVPATFPLTATMDQGTNTQNNGNLSTWFEQGFIRGTPAVGLPPSGSTFNSQAQPTHHYQMGNYSTNNGLLIDQNHRIANLTPVSPQSYYAYAFLTAGGNIGGNNVMTNICILQHADGVNETNLFFAYDWFNANQAGSLALKANGRVNMYSRTVNNVNNGFPYLFETYFALNDNTSPVTNIVVMYGTSPGASSTTFIMAASASDVPVAPVITSGPVPATQSWYATQTATFTVQVAGTAPVTNSWFVEENGAYVPLTDGVDANGSAISGSGTTVLTITGVTVADATNYEFQAANSVSTTTSSPAALNIKGRAGAVTVAGWNNIDNLNFPIGSSATIYSTNDSSSATLTLSDGGVNNAYGSGITGDGASRSLMDGYMDAGDYAGLDAIAAVSGLTDPSYDVYIYCFSDQTRPSVSTNGLANYSVNGITNYAPVLGGTGASTYDITGTSVGGTGFNGFVQATTFTTNDFNKDLSVSSFGNYIVIHNVSPIGGTITVQAEADLTSFRSPMNGIQIVSTSTAQDFGINFLGNTTDTVSVPPVAPVIDSQVPVTAVNVLTNHVISTTFSVTVDASNAPPFYYQWYSGSTPIPGATTPSYVNVDTNNTTIYCIVSNFVGTATSTPIAVNIYPKPALSPYQAAIFAYNPIAYWPLNELDGNKAFDYAGTNDGTYLGTNILGQPGIPVTPGIGANTSVYFDGSSGYVDIPGSGGSGDLNIKGPITTIVWVQVPGGGENHFGTVLGHSDQSYRLSIVNSGPTPQAQSRFADSGPDIADSSSIADGNWHQLVGVYDGTTQYLYVDGKLAGTPAASTPAGSVDDVMIAAAPDYLGSRNFQGNVAQVAIIPSALTAAQIAQVYGSLDTAPLVTITPSYPTIYSGANVTFTANLSGTPATSLQWYYIDTSNNSNTIVGATSATYTVSNAPASFSGYVYGVVAANAYGTNIATTSLSVQTSAAGLAGDISPINSEVYAGAPVTYTVNAQGSLPIYYQWMVDGAAVPGATNASYTTTAGCGTHTYMVTFTNDASGGNPGFSSQATLQGDANPTNVTFNTDGNDWQLNTFGTGTVPTIVNGVLELTDGTGNEASSAFYMVGQYLSSFTASFTYQGQGQADGVAFIVQNNTYNSAGVYSLGGGGGNLGYYGISNSIAFELNLYNGAGIAPGIDGSTYGSGGVAYQPTGPIDITTGDPINVRLDFANGVMSVSMTDATTLATYSTSYVFGPLTPILGGTDLGYVGFSGGDGGAASIQTISNFSFSAVVTPETLSVSPVTGNTFTISWPAADSNYTLQMTSSLTSPTWSAGPTPVVVNGMNQVTVNVNSGSSQQFYRLVRAALCQ